MQKKKKMFRAMGKQPLSDLLVTQVLRTADLPCRHSELFPYSMSFRTFQLTVLRTLLKIAHVKKYCKVWCAFLLVKLGFSSQEIDYFKVCRL